MNTKTLNHLILVYLFLIFHVSVVESSACPTDGTFVSGCPCPAETHFGSPGAVVAFNPSSASEESFTRVALNSKNVGETSWPLQTSSGFTLITKFKFTGTGAWFENVAYFGDAAQIGNIWLRRYGSGSEELLDFRIYQGSSGIATDSKCTIQSAAGSVPQNTVLNIIARWDGSVIELDINGVKASTDCSLVMQNRVLSETYIGSSFIDTSIGGFVDSSRFLLGDMYGMYAWSRHLSDSEAAQVLAGIETGGPDTLPTLQCTSCPTNGDFVPTCPCPAETHFGSPGAVVAFNPSGNEATFVRSSSHQVDLGTVAYNIQTNGGFTLIAKFMFSDATNGNYERIFGAMNAYDSDVNSFFLGRHWTSNALLVQFGDSAGKQCKIDDIVIAQNTQYSAVITYKASTNTVAVKLNDQSPVYKQCTADFNLPDFTVSHNKLGAPGYSNTDFFGGTVDGLYVFSRFLEEEQAAQVLAGIETGGPDTLPTLQCCAADGTYTPECGCGESTFQTTDAPINDRVISFNPAGGVRTFASASDYEDFGSSNSFAIKTNGGMTLVMKFRIHSGMPTSGQYPSIFSFKEGAGTGKDSNIYLNLANTMYFTVMKDTGTTYGTNACGMSGFVRPTVNEWIDLIIVYDRTAESISISFSHINSGTPASAACTVDLEDRIGTFRLNDNLYGSTEGTGFLGDVAGLYAYDRVLSSAEIDTILSGIKTDAVNEDTITVCAACPTDGTYLAECGCPSSQKLHPFPDPFIAFNPLSPGSTFVESGYSDFLDAASPDWSDSSVFMCDQDGGHDCVCQGYVRYGKGDKWTPNTYVYDKIYCASSSFPSGDPAPGVYKDCWCYPDPVQTADVGSVNWDMSNWAGFTFVGKIRFNTLNNQDRIFHSHDGTASSTNGNLLIYGSGATNDIHIKFIFKTKDSGSTSSCTAEIEPGDLSTNTDYNLVWKVNFATQQNEARLNDIVVVKDCSSIHDPPPYSSYENAYNAIGGKPTGYSHNAYPWDGNIYGLYAFKELLTETQIQHVLDKIKINAADEEFDSCQACPTDGTYLPECGCQESFYKNLKPVSAEIHMNTGVKKNWDDADAAAAAAGTRLFTCTELKEYLQQNGPIDANSASSWVACTGSPSCSGKDFMQAGPSQSGRSTGQLHQDDLGWGCLGTTRYDSTQIFMFYVPEALECAACPAGTVSAVGSTSVEDCVEPAQTCTTVTPTFDSDTGLHFTFRTDESPYSWQEAHDEAIANGKRIPTKEEMLDYLAKNGRFNSVDQWAAVTASNTFGADWIQIGQHANLPLGASLVDIGHSVSGDSNPKTFWNDDTLNKFSYQSIYVEVKSLIPTPTAVAGPGAEKYLHLPAQNYATKWRVSNAGELVWRPNIFEIYLYSDIACSQQVSVDTTVVTVEAPDPENSGYTPEKLFDGTISTDSQWRPKCCCAKYPIDGVANCAVGQVSFTLTFPQPERIQCVKTCGNLGWTPDLNVPDECGYTWTGYPDGNEWDGGVLLEASNDGGLNWQRVAGPTTASNIAIASADIGAVFPFTYDVTFPDVTTGEVLVVSSSTYTHVPNVDLSGEYTVTVGADTSVVTDAAGAVVATSAGGQEYVGIESARDPTSAYNIDGGGWTLVRRTAGPNWHPTTDELLGEIAYGTHSTNEKSLETFSIPFSDKLTSTTEFLFATGDGTDSTNGCDELWLVATIENIGGKVYQSAGGTLITYANEARNFITKHGATSAKWYNRAAYDWEPIISVIDYDQAITSGKLVYLGNGGSNYNDNIATCNGMNVFIRNGAGPSINVDSAITGEAQAYAKPQVILRYKSEVCPTTDTDGPSCPAGSSLPSGSSSLDACACDANLHSDLSPIYDGRPPISAWSYSQLSSEAACNTPLHFGVHDGVDTSGTAGTGRTACFETVDSNNYLQLDMSTEVIVTGIQTMGRASDAEYITLYQIKVSKDGATWTNAPCAEVNGSGFCVGNSDAGSVKQNDLASKVVARYVKLIVKGYSGHESLRMSVLAQTCVSCPNVAWQHYVPAVV